MALKIEEFVPSLVIGVGGTGSKILKKLRDFIEAEERLKTLEENGLFETVAMDTDLGDLEKLKIRNKIRTSANLVIADYIKVRRREDKEHGKKTLDWLPDESIFPQSFFNFDIASGAGQIRMYSRLALEKTAASVKSQLESCINGLRKISSKEVSTNAKNVNIYLICSMAGGTGSGAFLQIAAMCQLILKENGQQGQVTAYILSPDIYTKGEILPANQLSDIKANAYASLKEIDAFFKLASQSRQYGLFNPEDIEFIYHPNLKSEQIGDYSVPPFNNVYIIDSQNLSGPLPIDRGVGFSLYEQMIADALYARIFSPISSKSASVENNTIAIKLGASLQKTEAPYYGTLGAGRLIFPIDDIADYLGHRFVSEVICQNWKEMDADYFKKYKDYAKKKASGESVDKPFRHREFISYMNSVAGSDKTTKEEIKIAVQLYKSKTKDKDTFENGVNTLIQSKFRSFLTELNKGEDELEAEFNEDEGRIQLFNGNLPNISGIIGQISTNFNAEKASASIRSAMNNADDFNRDLDSKFQIQRNSLSRSIINEVFQDDAKTRSNPNQLKPHQLIKWMTISSKEEGMNIFFIRYFLSKEYDSMIALFDRTKLQLKALEEELKFIDDYSKDTDPKGKSKSPSQAFQEIVNPKDLLGIAKSLVSKKSLYLDFLTGGKNIQKMEYYTTNRINVRASFLFLTLKLEVLEKVIEFISYEDAPSIRNSDGILQILHYAADYVQNSLEEDFIRETKKLEDYTPSVDRKGVTRGVYHDSKAKQNIWKQLQSSGGSSIGKINETYQKMLTVIETAWRKIDNCKGTMDPDSFKFRKEKEIHEMNGLFKENLLQPSTEYFKKALNERYNILSAMEEEYEFHNPGMDKSKIKEHILAELRRLFENCAPFGKTMDVSNLSSISTIAYSVDLIPHNVQDYVKSITTDSGVNAIESLENKQIILILRICTGFTINDFKTIPEYFESYMNSILTRHIDYRWDAVLPETTREQENYFFRLFVRSLVTKMLEFIPDPNGLYNGRSKINFKFFDNGKNHENFANDFKKTYQEFKKIIRKDIRLRTLLTQDHDKARELDFNGIDKSYSIGLAKLQDDISNMEDSLVKERRPVLEEFRIRITYLLDKEFKHLKSDSI